MEMTIIHSLSPGINGMFVLELYPCFAAIQLEWSHGYSGQILWSQCDRHKFVPLHNKTCWEYIKVSFAEPLMQAVSLTSILMLQWKGFKGWPPSIGPEPTGRQPLLKVVLNQETGGAILFPEVVPLVAGSIYFSRTCLDVSRELRLSCISCTRTFVCSDEASLSSGSQRSCYGPGNTRKPFRQWTCLRWGSPQGHRQFFVNFLHF